MSCLGLLLHGLAGDDPAAGGGRRAARASDPELDDSDVAFQAQMTLAYAEGAVRGPDEELEQAVDDCDAALELIRADDLAQARALLRRVIDAGIPVQSARACAMLATLEYGEGDVEQAYELLEYVADGDDYVNGFAAAVNRHLIAESSAPDPAPTAGGGAPHPVLAALVGYQRLGREAGIAAVQECAGHPDPAVCSTLAKSMLAQVYVSLGVPRSQGIELLDEAAAAGDPLALSHAAVISSIIRDGDEDEEVVELLRRAHAQGHPALAPWVAHALGTALERQDDPDGGPDPAGPRHATPRAWAPRPRRSCCTSWRTVATCPAWRPYTSGSWPAATAYGRRAAPGCSGSPGSAWTTSRPRATRSTRSRTIRARRGRRVRARAARPRLRGRLGRAGRHRGAR